MALAKCPVHRCRLALLALILVILCLLLSLSRAMMKVSKFSVVKSWKHHQQTKRKINANESNDSFISTCSHAADTRGPHQQVISYSLYGNLLRVDIAQKYLIPLMKTVGEVPEIYPGKIYAGKCDLEESLYYKVNIWQL